MNINSGAVVLQHEIMQITNYKGITTAVFSELSLSLICICPEVSLAFLFVEKIPWPEGDTDLQAPLGPMK